MAEVFISYSQKERERVAPIASRLAELGVEAWFDREIPPGISFGKYIRDKLDEAKVALVCWSTEAVKSEWVDSEADSARERGIYVPVYVTRCRLQPPFNRIQTEDLSTWNGAANDPTWLKVVDQIAKLLGRDGVAAAARAHAAGDDQTLYEFAKRYSDEPAARSVWRSAEIRHREEFESRLEEARTAAAARAARISAEASDLDARIETTVPIFEAWIADERRGTATGPKPDPLALVKRYVPAEERKLRDEVAALSSALAQGKGVEEELETARAEIARLSEQSDAATNESAVLRERVTELSAASAEAKTLGGKLEAAKTEIAGLSRELDAATNNGEGLRQQVKALSDASNEAKVRKEELRAAKDEIVTLSDKLAVASTNVQQSALPARLSLSRASGLVAIVSVLVLVFIGLLTEKRASTAIAAKDAAVRAWVDATARASTAEKALADAQTRVSSAEKASADAQTRASGAEKALADALQQGSKTDFCAASFEAKKATGDLGDNPDKVGYIRWCIRN